MCLSPCLHFQSPCSLCCSSWVVPRERGCCADSGLLWPPVCGEVIAAAGCEWVCLLLSHWWSGAAHRPEDGRWCVSQPGWFTLVKKALCCNWMRLPRDSMGSKTGRLWWGSQCTFNKASQKAFLFNLNLSLCPHISWLVCSPSGNGMQI